MGCGGDGGGGVRVVEAADCGGGGSGGGGGESEFPLRMPVRVLLVEGDNSTRKIIAALLSKSGYTVFAATDGLEAWKVLREKADSIDLILTEAELPSISGFVLLNMIMEHESCKQIPVIMMSSHDSISVVFKCLLKGAADFLVKPVRKNELRNLWQHVWRRQYTIGSQGVIDSHEAEHLAEQKQEPIEKKASNGSSDNVISVKQSEKNSKKDSDAQSSCTRSEMEVESTYMQPIQEITQDSGVGVSHLDKNAEKCKATGKAEIMIQDDTEDNSTMLDSLLTPPSNKVCDSTAVTREKDKAEIVAAGTDSQTAYHTTCTQAVDLIGSIDKQHYHNHEIRNGEVPGHGFAYTAQSAIHCANKEAILGPGPHLELSLRRYLHPISCQTVKDKNGALDHSNFSAFSLYNSKTAIANRTTQKIRIAEDNNSLSANTQDKDSSDIKISHENDSASHANQDQGMLATSHTLSQQGATIPPPVPIIPVPVPVMWQAGSQIMQPIFYPSQALWTTVPSVQEEIVQGSSSNHYDPGGFTGENVPEKFETSHDLLPQKVRKDVELGKQQGCISFNGSSDQVECGGVPGAIYDDKSKEASICKSSVENTSPGNVPAEELRHNIDQREAALAKFRLKRKDRCFDKKVRYESRKRLAEQRPRVKGQFVRQRQETDSRNG